MHSHKSFIQHFQNGKHCLCCRVQATVLSGQHAALKHSLSCAWHLLSVLSRALCAKEKKPFNCNSIKPFSSTLVCRLCYMIVLLWTNNTLLQLPVLSLQASLYISSALQYSHYYAKRAGFIFEGFEKSWGTKGSTLSEWMRLQAWNGKGGNKQQGWANSSFVALPSKKLLIRHRAGH